MSMQGTTDTLVAKPKFPVERTVHGEVTFSLNVAANLPTTVLQFTKTIISVANGWIANSVNMGNVGGVAGWNQLGPSVVNVSGNTVYISQSVGNTLPIGTLITFFDPITRRANANNANANTYLVSATRMSNGNSLAAHSNSISARSDIAHQGWVHVKPQTGYVKSIAVKNAGNQMSNGSLVISSNSTYYGGGGAAATFTVNANGSIVSITMTANGGNYFITPVVTAPFTGNAVNAVNATFTVTMGGRANRIITEVLSVANNITVNDQNSGGLWLPGR